MTIFAVREGGRGGGRNMQVTHNMNTQVCKIIHRQIMIIVTSLYWNSLCLSLITALRQKCPNKYSKSLVTPEDRSYTDNSTGIKYNCVVADNSTTVQRKQCTTGCSKTIDGVDTKLCCKVKINMTVSRLFKCFPMNDSEEEEDSENGVIEMYFDVLNQRKCDCFRCDAICPHPSVNDNNDSKTDNDLTEESPSEEVTLEEPTLDLTQQ